MSEPRPLVFLDLETTGLSPEIHEVWEAAWAVEDGPIQTVQLPHVVEMADPDALKVCRYHERVRPVDAGDPLPDVRLRDALTGVTIVGANPAFDAAFLRARWTSTPWHYRLLDIQAYAMPVLGHERPQGLATIAADLRSRGFEIPKPDHTAARDVATLRASFRTLQKLSNTPKLGEAQP